ACQEKAGSRPDSQGPPADCRGEFKAKCLNIMDEINKTGKSMIVTKRGVPVIKVVPIRNAKKTKDDFFGRLKGIIEIVGDGDDLIKPVFPLQNYDLLK
ncbi:MAG TPA: type II toxin-antitoxin system prevent-host-death family antitoxin, partial [Terriglobales bacterium]